MKVEASLGDVVDRVSILHIKHARLADEGQRANVQRELDALTQAWTEQPHPAMADLTQWEQLIEVNGSLWDVEDALREHEARSDFSAEFVRLARSVYHLNDRRAALKRQVNDALGSELIEEKSYSDYTAKQDPTLR